MDGFLAFSLSVQNRRKSRAGQSLEHHLEALFQARSIRFSRGAETENRNRPDFLFPGHAEYTDSGFSPDLLTMLESKSTLKDRWRQVLPEAARIPSKHLLTLEPAISENQTDQMKAASPAGAACEAP
ncbi:type II restriction endonuclease [Mesorhizobium sp. M2A.F.Ca.ET.043.05.1.1]|uniref:type II restriction endonuclease n=1 Tax=Mesorhizobium sp. M2A.F.Ca.ET.043.05.1.1 TaxID=2493671 RepID=UPI001AECE056|nr:type II restriction endonuclease [Mesorhizobium sp. M2A.F.Ca.ET.043.05.1.1]